MSKKREPEAPKQFIPPAPRVAAEEGVSWVAPGRVEDQPPRPDGTRWKAMHATQDSRGLWYITSETTSGELIVDAVDIHHQDEVIKELKGSSRNMPGIEVHIDPVEREEGRGYFRERHTPPKHAKRAKAWRKERKAG